jgi:hypothetical protein
VLKEVGRSEAMKKAAMGKNPTMEGNKKSATALAWQRGFANVAQGIAKTCILLQRSTRMDASGVAIVLTGGGRPSSRRRRLQSRICARLRISLIVQIKFFPKEEASS